MVKQIPHSTECKCVRCSSVRASTPEKLVGTWYKTKSTKMEVVSVEFSGCWLVNYTVTPFKSRFTSASNKTSWLTIKNWNIYCAAWRKDLCPGGVPGKGWRAGERIKKVPYTPFEIPDSLDVPDNDG